MSFCNPVMVANRPGARSLLRGAVERAAVLVVCSEQMLGRMRSDNVLRGIADLPNLRFEHGFGSNPSLKEMSVIADTYAEAGLDLIVGIGGGSAMDTAKISSAAIPAVSNGVNLSDLLDDGGLFSRFNSIDCILMPSTAGTGSEVTPFATVWDYDHNIKRSLSHATMYAKQAIVDSEFLYSVPQEVALSTGLDALNQALESLWNVNANEITRSLGIRAAVWSLNSLLLLDQLDKNRDIAHGLATASLLAGLAISHTRTALCHSVSYPLTLKFGLPHGFACGFSMLEVLNFNAGHIKDDVAMIERHLDGPNIYQRIEEIYAKYRYYERVRHHIESASEVLSLMSSMTTPGRADNNIRAFTGDDLRRLLQGACMRAGLQP